MLRSILSGSLGVADIVVLIISSAAVVFLTMPIHEFAHGFIAVKLGDNTPKWQGRLTLNPFAHIDLYGALCILLLGFGWAKPVQINPRNFKNPKRDMALVALAGPVANLIMALIFLILSNLALQVFYIYYLGVFFYYVAYINISLAVFNLIPVPPFDGSRILGIILPNKAYFGIMKYERFILIAVLALSFTGVLNIPLGFLTNGIYDIFSVIAQIPLKLLGLIR